LNTKTDEIVEYLLPRNTNIRRVSWSTMAPVRCCGSATITAAPIVKVEPAWIKLFERISIALESHTGVVAGLVPATPNFRVMEPK